MIRSVVPGKEEVAVALFVVQMKNVPGQLAAALDALAAAGVNVMITAVTSEDRGTVLFVGDDDAATRAAFTDADIPYEEKSSLVVRLDNKPGAGAAFCRRLAAAGVNVEFLLPLEVDREQAVLVVVVDDEDRARELLSDVLLAG
jgi:hypothetical protein